MLERKSSWSRRPERQTHCIHVWNCRRTNLKKKLREILKVYAKGKTLQNIVKFIVPNNRCLGRITNSWPKGIKTELQTPGSVLGYTLLGQNWDTHSWVSTGLHTLGLCWATHSRVSTLGYRQHWQNYKTLFQTYPPLCVNFSGEKKNQASKVISYGSIEEWD